MDGDVTATDNNTDLNTDLDTDNESTEISAAAEESRRPIQRPSILRRRHSEHFRRHEFLSDRLQAYSDAVFAIVGTILIVYLQRFVSTFSEPNTTIMEQAINKIPLYVVYYLTFFYVSTIWLNHSRIFGIIERVNDVMVWLNMLLLYVVSFVPLTFGVLGEFKNTYQGILIPSINMVLIGAVTTILLWYAFKRQKFLHIIDLPEDHHTIVKRVMYFHLLLAPFFALLAIGLGIISFTAAQVFFYLSFGMLIVPRVIIYVFWKVRKKEADALLTQALGIYISKDRVEFYTDGIYSIVSTLVILEITVDGIPSRELVDSKYNGNLVDALSDNLLSYVAYFTTFLVISLLWFVHHSLFNFVKKLNPVMLLVHFLSCSIIGLIPPVMELLAIFYDVNRSGEDEATVVRMGSLTIGVIGILQLVFLSLMYFTDTECVDPILFHTKTSLHLFLKVLIIPVVCVITYWTSLGSPEFRQYSYYVLYLCSPLTFVMVSIAMKSGKLRSCFSYCWEVQNRLKERLQKKVSHSYEIEMEAHGSNKKSDKN